jgi:hypothetical protein
MLRSPATDASSNVSAPPLMSVSPVKLLLLRIRVRMPSPFFWRPPAPRILPARVRSSLPATVSVLPPVSILFVIRRSSSLERRTPLPARLRSPVPRALSWPRTIVPLVSVVPPV